MSRTTHPPEQLSFLPDAISMNFAKFHQANPHVYRALVNLARAWKDAGHKDCAMDMLFAKLRWDYGIETHGEQFKLNNNYRSMYTRLIEANEPDLTGFITKRPLSRSL